jgi:environmental stress-induced protein Ves
LSAKTSLQVLRSTQYKITPWKNGGGETTEIAVSPLGAGLDEFDWRISTARVASDGPFSRFPGIDRTLAVLDGAGLRLSIDGRAPIVLTSGTAPFAFAGDVDAEATLIDGEITDLNVMTRRDRFSHRITRVEITDSTEFEPAGAEALLYCAAGAMRVQTPTGSAVLWHGDALRSSSKRAWRLQAESHALVYSVEFFDVSSATR